MYVEINRISDNGESTIGVLSVDYEFECFTLEDTYREEKIDGKTRIPEGEYAVKLRTAGGMTKKYEKKYGGIHKGMLWLQDVEGFEWVYVHTGNKATHTDGCVLVGNSCNTSNGQTIGGSVAAYKKLYPRIAEAIESGEEVTITII